MHTLKPTLLLLAMLMSSFVYAQKETAAQLILDGETINATLEIKFLGTGFFTFGFKYLNESGEEITVITEEYTYNLISIFHEETPIPFPKYDNEKKIFVEKVLEGYYTIYYLDIDIKNYTPINTNSSNSKYNSSYALTSIFLFRCESDEPYKKGNTLRNIKGSDYKKLKECTEALEVAKENKLVVMSVTSKNYRKLLNYYQLVYGAINEHCADL